MREKDASDKFFPPPRGVQSAGAMKQPNKPRDWRLSCGFFNWIYARLFNTDKRALLT
jgi:hypothetical protein